MIADSVTKIAGAETGHHLLGLGLRGERDQHVVLAVEHVGHAGEPGLHHGDGGDAVARAHAGKVERLLDVILVAAPSSTGPRPAARRRTTPRASPSRRASPWRPHRRRRRTSSWCPRRSDACHAHDRGRAPSGSGSRDRSRARPRGSCPCPIRRCARRSRARTGTTEQPGWALVTGSKSSVSSAWPNMPLASAALTAVVRKFEAMTVASSTPPRLRT